jgi:3-keto-5-aminohexanoate cleavage enzyme
VAYTDYLAGDPVVVTAALTGGVHGKEANPNLPETPAEIGRAAAAAEDAGASVVHVHAREDTGERSFATERFQAIDDEIRARVDDVIIQHSTGGTGAPDERRHHPLRTDPPPEMASLDMGPLNRYTHLTSENTRGLVDSLYDEMQERGIKPELEVFNDGHLNELHQFLDRRDLADPVYATLIFGPGTLTRPRPRNFLNLVSNLPSGAQFNTLGFGRHQLPFANSARRPRPRRTGGQRLLRARRTRRKQRATGRTRRRPRQIARPPGRHSERGARATRHRRQEGLNPGRHHTRYGRERPRDSTRE